MLRWCIGPQDEGKAAVRNGLLRGKRVLVLEDEPIIAMLLEELVETAGGEADCVTSLEGAASAIEQRRPDVAVLDINIKDRHSFDLARQLADLGVPILFASGYRKTIVPPDMAHVPIVTKPYSLEDLDQAFKAAFAPADRRL